jgi:hypothetical protein
MARRVLGLSEASVTMTYLDGPGITIELICYASPRDRTIVSGRPCDAGHTHLAFNVSGLDEMVLAARAYGFSPLGETVSVMQGPNTGRRAVYLRDTDQITIELIES